VLAGKQRTYPSKALIVRLYSLPSWYGSQQNAIPLQRKLAEHLSQSPKRMWTLEWGLWATADSVHLWDYYWIIGELFNCCRQPSCLAAGSQGTSLAWALHHVPPAPLWQPSCQSLGNLHNCPLHSTPGFHHCASNFWSLLWHPQGLHEDIIEDFSGKSCFQNFLCWRVFTVSHQAY